MPGRRSHGVRLGCGHYVGDPSEECPACRYPRTNPGDGLFDRPERAEPVGPAPHGGMTHCRSNWHTPYDRR